MAGDGQCRPPDLNVYPALNATSPPPPPANVWTVEGRSFSTVAKTKPTSRFPPIQLAPRQYGSKDGKPSISFTPVELQVGVDYLKFSLVAKFSGGRPPIEDIRKAFSTAWTLNGQCSIGAWDARHILIVLDTEQDARRVLAHPMRKLGHSLFRVFRWSTDFSTRREPTTTTTWIRLASLPPQLYNQGYIESIVSSFGRFLAMDSRTVCFTNPSFARVCVEIDISRELPNEVWISTGIDCGFWQEIVYENRLHYCSKCKLHGHLLMDCRKVKQKQDVERDFWAARADPTPKSPISTPKVTTYPTQPNTHNKATEWVTVQRRKKGKSSSFQKDGMEQTMLSVSGTQSEISPTKGHTKVNDSAIPHGTTCPLNPASQHQNIASQDSPPAVQAGPTPPAVQAGPTPSIIQTDTSPNDVTPVNNEAMETIQVINYTTQTIAGNSSGSTNQMKELASIDQISNDGVTDVCTDGVTNDTISHVEKSSAELQILEEFAQKISSYGDLIYCAELGKAVEPRVIFLHLLEEGEDDTTIFQFLDNIVNENRQVQQEGSGIPSEESENHDVHAESIDPLKMPNVPIQKKIRQRKKKGSRSSTRSCPKQKDNNFVWS